MHNTHPLQFVMYLARGIIVLGLLIRAFMRISIRTLACARLSVIEMLSRCSGHEHATHTFTSIISENKKEYPNV